MAQQQDLFSPPPDRPASSALERASGSSRTVTGQEPRATAPWLARTELLVRVIVRLYLGLLIIVLPWLRFWTDNGLFSYLPGTSFLAGSGFLRGVVSGLGLLNVAMAFQELFPSARKQ